MADVDRGDDRDELAAGEVEVETDAEVDRDPEEGEAVRDRERVVPELDGELSHAELDELARRSAVPGDDGRERRLDARDERATRGRGSRTAGSGRSRDRR